MKFFIDHSEDEVLPCAGNSSLVDQYEALADAASKWIVICDSKEEMYETASEFSAMARNGTRSFKEFTDKELLEKIRKLEK